MPAELIVAVVVVAPASDGSECLRVAGLSAFHCSEGNAQQVSGLCADEEGIDCLDEVPQTLEIRLCFRRDAVEDLQQLDDQHRSRLLPLRF